MSISELEATLDEEREAIAKLDSERLLELAQLKEKLFTSIKPETESKKDLYRLRTLAQVNLLLLNDTIDLVAERLGRGRSEQTYDERGQPNHVSGTPRQTRI